MVRNVSKVQMTSSGVIGRSVVKARLLAQRVEHRKLVGSELDLFGDEAVLAARLVLGGHRQGVEDLPDPRRRHAFDDKGVEGIEGADRGEPHRPALRRVRVDVIEILEVGAVFEIAEQRHSRRRDSDCGGSHRSERQNERNKDCSRSAHDFELRAKAQLPRSSSAARCVRRSPATRTRPSELRSSAAAAPIGGDAAGTLDDRNHRAEIVRLEAGFKDEVDEAAGEQTVGVAIGAEARQLCAHATRGRTPRHLLP